MNALERAIHSLETARRMTVGMLEGIDPGQWLHQPIEGGQHVAWIVGHLAIADDWGLVALGLERQCTQFEASFPRTCPINGDPQAYPSPVDLREVFDAAHRRLVDRLGQLGEEDLPRPTSGPISQYAPDLGTLMASHIWHEGFHGGQLALISRSLGMAVRWG